MSRKIEEINLDNINFSKQKINSSNKFLYVYSEKKPLIIKLPKTRLPFGVQKDNLSKKNQYLLDLSFENNAKILEHFENLNTYIIQKVKDDFFADKTLEEVKKMYVNYIKYPENPMYSPSFRAKIILTEDLQPKCDFYESEKNEEGKYPKIDVKEKGGEPYLFQVMAKSSYIESIIECIGLWFFNDKFGLSFKVSQVMLHPNQVYNEPPPRDCDFLVSDSDTSNSDAEFLGE